MPMSWGSEFKAKIWAKIRDQILLVCVTSNSLYTLTDSFGGNTDPIQLIQNNAIIHQLPRKGKTILLCKVP